MSKLIGRKVRIKSTNVDELSAEYNGAVGTIVEDSDNRCEGMFKGCITVDNPVSGGILPFFPEELRYLNNKEVKLCN